MHGGGSEDETGDKGAGQGEERGLAGGGRFGFLAKTEDRDVGAFGEFDEDGAGGQVFLVEIVEFGAKFEGAAANGGVAGGGVGFGASEGLGADGVFLDFGGAAGNFQLADVAEEVLELFAARKCLTFQHFVECPEFFLGSGARLGMHRTILIVTARNLGCNRLQQLFGG